MTERAAGEPARLVLYDDDVARRFEPFALTRPVATLTAGITEAWIRWQTALQMSVAAVIAAPHLGEFDEASWVRDRRSAKGNRRRELPICARV